MLTGQSRAHKNANHILRWIDIRQHIKKNIICAKFSSIRRILSTDYRNLIQASQAWEFL